MRQFLQPWPFTRIHVVMACAIAAGAAAHAQTPGTLEDVLQRFRTYQSTYTEEYSATVAVERYHQTYTSMRYRTRVEPFEVRLESEFAIVRSPVNSQWLGFRDVRRVNQKVVGASGRLSALMVDQSASAIEVGRMIAIESARYNIGPGFRSINSPSLVFEVLDPRHQSRMRFSKGREERIDGVPVWRLRFVEHAQPTLVQTRAGQNSPAEGSAWIDPLTGALLRAEVVVRVGHHEAAGTENVQESLVVIVTFARDPHMKMRVPVKMEEHDLIGTHAVIKGEATYSDYRQFAVHSRVLAPQP